MSTTGDDDAWRAIVDNYGERPALPPDDPDQAPEEALAGGPPPYRPLDDPDAALARTLGAEGRFVPPPPPPVPRPDARRAVAWAGVLGAPVLLLVLVVLAVPLPAWLAAAAGAWFVGGFAYLVAQMPRGPGDPWDDGARV